jgi:hypothetical protein
MPKPQYCFRVSTYPVVCIEESLFFIYVARSLGNYASATGITLITQLTRAARKIHTIDASNSA